MDKVKVLVPVSGGKDSQACLKLALQSYPADEVRGLFCDTQFEHPLTYQHIERMRDMYGVRIDTVCEGSVEQQAMKHRRFPGGGARFCTEELKIWPTKRYCKALAAEQGGFEVWYGMRSMESPEREKRYAGKVCDEVYLPHEVQRKYPQYLGRMGVRFRLSVLEWSDADVIDFVGIWNLNPLYRAGFPRVGCFPCLASGDKWKAKAFNHDEFGREQFAKVVTISAKIGKSVWTSDGYLRSEQQEQDSAGCLLCAY